MWLITSVGEKFALEIRVFDERPTTDDLIAMVEAGTVTRAFCIVDGKAVLVRPEDLEAAEFPELIEC